MGHSKQILDMLAINLAEFAKAAHLKSLRQDVAGFNRHAAYLGLSYRFVHFEEPALILPDTMLAFLTTKGIATPFLDGAGEVNQVYLPLSSQVALHGYKGNPIMRDLRTVNRILASCADKNFIAQTDSEQLRALAPRIGKNAQIVSPAELRKIVRETIDGY